MKIDINSIPVVILKSHFGSLGIARSLGRLGVPVYAVHSDANDPTLASKYYRKAMIWDIDKQPVAESLKLLDDLGCQLDRSAILISTSDATTAFVSYNAEKLKKHYMFPSQPPELVTSLIDKKKMCSLAKEHNIPIPLTMFPQSKDELMDNLKEFQFPLLFKCINGTRLTANKEPKMIKVNNETELIEAHDQWEVSDKPNFMLQEYIPGGEDSSWIFNGFFDGNSHCVIGFTGKKIRQHPAYMGAASLGVCLQNDELNHITCRFMKAIGYQGVLDVDYCYDYRDGKYKVLDVNPRIGSSFRLFVDRNGMDVARALYLSLTNQPVLPLTIHEGRKWVVENQDISSCLVYRKDGNLTLKEFLASFKGLKETAWIASDDMQPFLKLCKSYFKKLFV